MLASTPHHSSHLTKPEVPLRSTGNGAHLFPLPHLAASCHLGPRSTNQRLVPRVQRRATRAWFGGPKVCLIMLWSSQVPGYAFSVWVTQTHSLTLSLSLSLSAPPPCSLVPRLCTPRNVTHRSPPLTPPLDEFTGLYNHVRPHLIARSVDGALERGERAPLVPGEGDV